MARRRYYQQQQAPSDLDELLQLVQLNELVSQPAQQQQKANMALALQMMGMQQQQQEAAALQNWREAQQVLEASRLSATERESTADRGLREKELAQRDKIAEIEATHKRQGVGLQLQDLDLQRQALEEQKLGRQGKEAAGQRDANTSILLRLIDQAGGASGLPGIKLENLVRMLPPEMRGAFPDGGVEVQAPNLLQQDQQALQQKQPAKGRSSSLSAISRGQQPSFWQPASTVDALLWLAGQKMMLNKPQQKQEGK